MKHTIKLLAVAAGIFATVTEADTDYYNVHGTNCHSTTLGLMGEAAQHGLGNGNSAQALTVACPVTIPEKNYTEAYLNFSGYDRSGNDNLSCTLNFSDDTGNSFSTATSKTTGSSNYSIKYGNAVRIYPTNAQTVMWINCRIPPTNNGWMSVLTSVYTTLSY